MHASRSAPLVQDWRISLIANKSYIVPLLIPISTLLGPPACSLTPIHLSSHPKNMCNSERHGTNSTPRGKRLPSSHEKYYGAAPNVLAGVGVGMGGGPCRSQLPPGSLRTFHARAGSGN